MLIDWTINTIDTDGPSGTTGRRHGKPMGMRCLNFFSRDWQMPTIPGVAEAHGSVVKQEQAGASPACRRRR